MPLVGTWIEIRINVPYLYDCIVVPLVGTWIEISKIENRVTGSAVVPLVGTWIEIVYIPQITKPYMSCPSWARGLKYLIIY